MLKKSSIYILIICVHWTSSITMKKIIQLYPFIYMQRTYICEARYKTGETKTSFLLSHRNYK